MGQGQGRDNITEKSDLVLEIREFHYSAAVHDTPMVDYMLQSMDAATSHHVQSTIITLYTKLELECDQQSTIVVHC